MGSVGNVQNIQKAITLEFNNKAIAKNINLRIIVKQMTFKAWIYD